MRAGDAHAQDAGPDAEDQRGVEDERLAVDPGRDRLVGLDLEGRRRPLAPRALHTAALAGGPADDRDAQQAVVDPRARPRADRAAEPVLVVGDEHRRAPAVFVPAGPFQRMSMPVPVGPRTSGMVSRIVRSFASR